MQPINYSDLQKTKGGEINLAVTIVAFAIGYVLKEYTSGFWDAENVKY